VISKVETASDFHCQPPLLISYEIVSLENKKVVVVTIPESEDKPHLVVEPDGEQTVYVRMHNKSMPTGRLTARNMTSATTEADKALVQSAHVKTLLKYLQTNEYITAKRYAKLINISERRAARLLMELAANQIVIPVERDKDVVYAASGKVRLG